MGRRFADPLRPVAVAHRQPDGNPPQETINEFLADSRLQGCTCEPTVNIVRHKGRPGGQINLGHQTHCPLLRVLQEGA